MEEPIKGTGTSDKAETQGPDVSCRPELRQRTSKRAEDGQKEHRKQGGTALSNISHLIRIGWFQKQISIISACWGNLEEGYTHNGNCGPPPRGLVIFQDQNLRCNRAAKLWDWKKGARPDPTCVDFHSWFHSANDHSPLPWCGATVYHFTC